MPSIAPLKNPTMGILIALAILNVVGFFVLYYKIDLDASFAAGDAALLSQQLMRIENRKSVQPVSADQSFADFPIVVYGREGLLVNKPEERAYLQEKIVNPVKDYYNAKALGAVSIYIEIPQAKNAPYDLKIIHRDGSYEGSLFGRRGEVSRYWLPPCMDPKECGITPEFAAKYPELIKQLGQ